MTENYNESLKALSQQFHAEMKTARADELGEIKSPRLPNNKNNELLGGLEFGSVALSLQIGEIYSSRLSNKQLSVGEVPDGMIVPPPENSPAGIPNPQAGRKK